MLYEDSFNKVIFLKKLIKINTLKNSKKKKKSTESTE